MPCVSGGERRTGRVACAVEALCLGQGVAGAGGQEGAVGEEVFRTIPRTRTDAAQRCPADQGSGFSHGSDGPAKGR